MPEPLISPCWNAGSNGLPHGSCSSSSSNSQHLKLKKHTSKQLAIGKRMGRLKAQTVT